MAELRQISNAKSTQNRCQENKNKNLAAKLVEEYEDFDDDVFMANDLSDTDENLSAALSQFVQWLSDGVTSSADGGGDASSQYQGGHATSTSSIGNFLTSLAFSIINRYNHHTPINFNYLLITNDESFVAIDQILPRLTPSGPNYFRAKEFRSRFRYFEAVDYHGPSPETSYISATYPPIPTDSGCLLSKDLVQFIAKSAGSGVMKTFSSIGKSLGVWLAPACPNYVDDFGWNFDNKTCSIHSMVAGPFTSGKSMMQAWNNYLTCGKMCACP